MPQRGHFRERLASLWVSQAARVMADNCLRLFVVLEVFPVNRTAGWHLVTFLFLVPAVLLAPLNGAICNSLPKRGVLIGAAAYGFLVVGGGYVAGAPWLFVWALIAIGSAIYGPARSALLPAAARDTHWPLTRINGFFEMAAAAAVVGGFLLAAGKLVLETGETLALFGMPIPSPPILAIGLNGLALGAALPVWFLSDVRRPEFARQAVAGFFRDAARIWGESEIRGCLLGLALLRGLVTASIGAVVTGLDLPLDQIIMTAVYVSAGVAGGSFLAGLQRHPRRALGLVPFGAVGVTVGIAIAAGGTAPGWFLCVVLGGMVGLVNVPLSALYQANLPPDARGNGMAIRNFTDYVVVALLSGIFFGLAHWAGLTPAAQLWSIAGLAALATAVCWWWLRREVVEQLMECALWPFYNIRSFGPGIDEFPPRGPALVIANHSAWFDPFFVAKGVPRELIPMMTSLFFDLPVIRWFMVHIARAIRVEASRFRREVPEIAQAVAVLDRGKTLIVFPEGAMRKKEEQVLRQFGQGVWHILRERPATPVYVCWIEGAWGCYFSYWNGPPTKNKKLDFRRRIDVAVRSGEVLAPELLEDQRKTRAYLMKRCLEARQILGLAPVDVAVKEEDQTPAEEDSLNDN